MPITWETANLEKHWRKHRHCFEDLDDHEISLGDYRAKSEWVINTAWSEYEAREVDYYTDEYRPVRAYYADERLCIAVTDNRRVRFITCYHLHFYGEHGVSPSRRESPGSLMLQYNSRLKKKCEAGEIINFRRVRRE